MNDAIVHGIPTGYRLRDGDLVSIDFGAELGGWVGDSAISFIVGEPRVADVRLVETAERALAAGIRRRSSAIGSGTSRTPWARCAARRVRHPGRLRRSRRRPPHARGPVRPERGPPAAASLRHGMVLAIEPMLIGGGTDGFHAAPDGWTLRTDDGSRAAHTEHTVAITRTGPRILTAR